MNEGKKKKGIGVEREREKCVSRQRNQQVQMSYGHREEGVLCHKFNVTTEWRGGTTRCPLRLERLQHPVTHVKDKLCILLNFR